MVEINESVLAVIAMEKSDTNWVPLLLISIVLLFFGGFSFTPTTWLNTLTFGLLILGVITLTLACCEFGKRSEPTKDSETSLDLDDED